MEEDVVILHVRIPKSMDRDLERLAFETDSSKQSVVRRALKRELKIEDNGQNAKPKA